MSQRVFFLEAIKDIKTIGSITGSSKQLIEKMIKPIPFENKLQIVEFGAGDGCITRAIQSKLSIGSHLKSFELNESLYQRLAGLSNEQVTLIHDSVWNLLEYVEPHSIDSIVSSIPLSNISIAEKKELLLQCKEALKPTGTLIQYQYSLADYKLLKAIFGQVELQFALLNIPPAFIYICRD